MIGRMGGLVNGWLMVNDWLINGWLIIGWSNNFPHQFVLTPSVLAASGLLSGTIPNLVRTSGEATDEGICG